MYLVQRLESFEFLFWQISYYIFVKSLLKDMMILVLVEQQIFFESHLIVLISSLLEIWLKTYSALKPQRIYLQV